MIKVMLEPGAYMPAKAHKDDAGYDLRAPEGFDVPPAGPKGAGVAVIDTGVHMLIPRGQYGSIRSKSGLNVRQDLTADGVIDSGYTGSIVVKLYNHGSKRRCFDAGDKIAQIIIQAYKEHELVQVEKMPETERGNNGFGSSGR